MLVKPNEIFITLMDETVEVLLISVTIRNKEELNPYLMICSQKVEPSTTYSLWGIYCLKPTNMKTTNMKTTNMNEKLG